MADTLYLDGTTYYYRIRVEDDDGNLSEWQSSSFTMASGIILNGEKHYVRLKAKDTADVESSWSAYGNTDDNDNNWFEMATTTTTTVSTTTTSETTSSSSTSSSTTGSTASTQSTTSSSSSTVSTVSTQSTATTETTASTTSSSTTTVSTQSTATTETTASTTSSSTTTVSTQSTSSSSTTTESTASTQSTTSSSSSTASTLSTSSSSTTSATTLPGDTIVPDISVSPNTTVEIGEPVLFDASGTTTSTDIIDSCLEYEWDFDDGHYLKWESPSASDRNGGRACVHCFMEPGTYTVRLDVTENKAANPDQDTANGVWGTSEFTTQEITVTGTAPMEGFEVYHAPFHARIAQYFYVQVPAAIYADPTNKLKVTITNEDNEFGTDGYSSTLVERSSLSAEESFLFHNAELTGVDTKYVIRFELLDSEDSLLSYIQEYFYKTYEGNPTVGINENNALCVNGTPFFPVTSYQIDPVTAENKPDVPEWGTAGYINTLLNQGYYAEGKNSTTWQQYINTGDTYDLKSIGPDVGNYFYEDTPRAADRYLWRNADPTTIAGYVNDAKANSAMLAWAWDDEPNLGGRHQKEPPPVLGAWQYISHDNDPNHPVYTNLYGYDWLPYYYDSTDGEATSYDYLGSETFFGKKYFHSDILCFDIYPLEYQNHVALTDESRGIFDLWMEAFDNLQSWNYDLVPCFNFVEVCDILDSRETDGPTESQVLMEAWLSVVHGAKGICWFNHFEYDTLQHDAMSTFVDQITALEQVILSTPTTKTFSDNANTRGSRVDTMVKEYGDQTYLFAVRVTEPSTEWTEQAEPESIEVTFTTEDVIDGSGTVYDESRSVTLSGGSFTDTFDRDDVHIYIFDNSDLLLDGTRHYFRIKVKDTADIESSWSAYGNTDDDDNNWFELGTTTTTTTSVSTTTVSSSSSSTSETTVTTATTQSGSTTTHSTTSSTASTVSTTSSSSTTVSTVTTATTESSSTTTSETTTSSTTVSTVTSTSSSTSSVSTVTTQTGSSTTHSSTTTVTTATTGTTETTETTESTTSSSSTTQSTQSTESTTSSTVSTASTTSSSSSTASTASTESTTSTTQPGITPYEVFYRRKLDLWFRKPKRRVFSGWRRKVNSFRKQPSEVLYIYGSILNNQSASEVIDMDNSSVTIVDDDSTDVTSSLVVSGSARLTDDPNGSYTDNAYAVAVTGGTETGSPYKITFLLHTNKGNTYEIDARMVVREI